MAPVAPTRAQQTNEQCNFLRKRAEISNNPIVFRSPPHMNARMRTLSSTEPSHDIEPQPHYPSGRTLSKEGLFLTGVVTKKTACAAHAYAETQFTLRWYVIESFLQSHKTWHASSFLSIFRRHRW